MLRVPRYLKGKEGRMVRIAKFRLGSEMREGREKRKCRLCGWAEEREHVVVYEERGWGRKRG